jgi:aryl-alcohol dehydrogenase-like predicted oxidoreductase/histidinol phosphatase-like enzyme
MRLSTAPDRDDERAESVIRAALSAGATLLDTADAYCHDERDVGHNERLVARALAGWDGDRAVITVATKGGMRRPNGAWLPDGRAKHLRAACMASRETLGVDIIDLYQLHVVDPKTPLPTSVRALAALRDEGIVRDVGLCNVTVNQIREALDIVPIASVQVSLSPLDDENLRNGVAEFCRDHDIRILAHRPLGGDRVRQIARDEFLSEIASAHRATPQDVALAWLMSFGDVVPLPGATRVETAASLASAIHITLSDDERAALDARFSGRLLRVPRAARRPARGDGEVAVVMGMPGAGKSVVARELESAGHARLNRDIAGGSLSALAKRVGAMIVAGQRRIVLDNTYATRKSRNEVIETAWERGVSVRCVWLTTGVPDAQINAIRRMIEAHGSLPAPEEIRARSRTDSRYLLPDAQFRYERSLEPPSEEEGFETVEQRSFVRAPSAGERRALILDLDDLAGSDGPALRDSLHIAPEWVEALTRRHADGWSLFVFAWRPQVARGEITSDDVDASFASLRRQLGVPMSAGCCPHDAGPPACWCRKPIPGRAIEYADGAGVDLARSVVVGSSTADRTMSERLGTRFESVDDFLSDAARSE